MKPIEMLKEIKNLLGVELSEQTAQEVQEVALAQMTLENGTVLEAESFEADNEVFIVTEDERVAVPVGEYTLEDGRILRVEEEGIIASIAEASEEVEEEVEATEELAEEDKYATKEELAEIKSMVEEIREMMKPKEEEMSEEVKEEAEELKEELSKPASEPLKHSPEAKGQKEYKKFSSNRPQTTLDRVFQKLNNR